MILTGQVWRNNKTNNRYLVVSVSQWEPEPEKLIVTYIREDGSDERLWSRWYEVFTKKFSYVSGEFV